MDRKSSIDLAFQPVTSQHRKLQHINHTITALRPRSIMVELGHNAKESHFKTNFENRR
jgi:hypothetical protein